MTFWSQAGALTRSELRIELRAGEVLMVTVPFGALALLLVPMAVGTDTPLLQRIGSGMFWTVVVLFGVIVTQRRSASDEPAQRDLMRLLGVDPAARFAARAIASTLLLLIFEVIIGLVAVILYDPEVRGWGWLALLLPLVAIGLGMLGTLAGDVAAGIAGRQALVPLLVIPLAVPMLLAAAETIEGLRAGTGILSWLILLVVMDLTLALAGTLTARPLEETTA